MPGTISRTDRPDIAQTKTPPERSGGVSFCLGSGADQHLQPCIAVSVHEAVELTSWAAPRTVLHAVTVNAPPMNNTVRSLRAMIIPPLSMWNDHDRSHGY